MEKARGKMVMPILHTFIHEIVVSAILAIAGSAAMWPIRKVQKAYKEATEKLEAVHTELTEQRTNCLATVSHQGNAQIELLSKVASTLEAMHLDQRELLGRLDK